jgi:hypothetical protein
MMARYPNRPSITTNAGMTFILGEFANKAPNSGTNSARRPHLDH